MCRRSALLCSFSALALAAPARAQTSFPWDAQPSAAPSTLAKSSPAKPAAPKRAARAPDANRTANSSARPAATTTLATAAVDADTHDLDAARALRDRADAIGALAVLDKLLQRSPNQGAALQMRAGIHLTMADYEMAIADLDAAIRLEPARSSLHVQRGLAWQKKGELEPALADFDRALKIDASDIVAWHTRALFHALRNNFDAALADNARALQIRPNDPALTAWRARWETERRAVLAPQAPSVIAPPTPAASATVATRPVLAKDPAADAAALRADYYYLKSQYREMLDVAEAALLTSPRHPDLIVRHARALHALRDDTHAEPELDTLLTQYPTMAEAFQLRGLVRKDRGKLDLAKLDLLKALELDPGNTQTPWGLALVHVAMGDNAGALPYLNATMRLAPNWTALSLRLSLSLDQRDMAAAEQDVATGERWGPATAYPFLAARGRYKLARGQNIEALTDLNAALTGLPTSLVARRWRAEANERLGNYLDALADVRQLQALTGADPVTASYKIYASNALLRMQRPAELQNALRSAGDRLRVGDYLAAIAAATREVEKPDGSTSVFASSFFAVRAAGLINLGRLELALADYDKAITLNPRAESALSARARLLAIYYRRFDSAQTDIGRALSVNPRSAEAMMAQAVVYSGRGELIRALTAADSAVSFAPKQADAYVARAAANVALERDDNATADFATALALQPRNATALYLRGSMHAKRGHHGQAMLDFNDAIEADARKSPGLYLARGKSHESLGDKERALADYQRALQGEAIGPIESAIQKEAAQKVADLNRQLPQAMCGKRGSDQCL